MAERKKQRKQKEGRKPSFLELDSMEREQFLQRLTRQQLNAEDYDIVAGMLASYAWLRKSLKDKEITIAQLEKLFLNASHEKPDTGSGEKDLEMPSSPIEGPCAETRQGSSPANDRGTAREGSE